MRWVFFDQISYIIGYLMKQIKYIAGCLYGYGYVTAFLLFFNSIKNGEFFAEVITSLFIGIFSWGYVLYRLIGT